MYVPNQLESLNSFFSPQVVLLLQGVNRGIRASHPNNILHLPPPILTLPKPPNPPLGLLHTLPPIHPYHLTAPLHHLNRYTGQTQNPNARPSAPTVLRLFLGHLRLFHIVPCPNRLRTHHLNRRTMSSTIRIIILLMWRPRLRLGMREDIILFLSRVNNVFEW